MQIKKRVLSIGLSAGMLASMVGSTGIAVYAATTTTSALTIVKNQGVTKYNNGGASVSVKLTANTSNFNKYKKYGAVTYWLKAYEANVVIKNGKTGFQKKDNTADALCKITSPNSAATIDYTDTNGGKLRGIRQGNAYIIYYVVRYKTSKNGSWQYQISNSPYTVNIGAKVKNEDTPVQVKPDDIRLSLSSGTYRKSNANTGISLNIERRDNCNDKVYSFFEGYLPTSLKNTYIEINPYFKQKVTDIGYKMGLKDSVSSSVQGNKTYYSGNSKQVKFAINSTFNDYFIPPNPIYATYDIKYEIGYKVTPYIISGGQKLYSAYYYKIYGPTRLGGSNWTADEYCNVDIYKR